MAEGLKRRGRPPTVHTIGNNTFQITVKNWTLKFSWTGKTLRRIDRTSGVPASEVEYAKTVVSQFTTAAA